MSRIQPKWFSEAVFSLVPNAKLVIRGQSYEGLEWFDDRPKPTEAEITAEMSRLQAEYDNNEYQRQRAQAYPSIAEQLDMQYWDKRNGTTTWADAIAATKAKYPKEQ